MSADPELAEALLAEVLLSLGGRGVHLVDGGWTTYLPEDADLPGDPDVLAADIEAHTGLTGVTVEFGWQDHADWEELWKVGLDARRVTDHLVVTPSWIEPDTRPGDIVLVLDPGMAFGNAEHGTTRGCLRLLDAAVRPHDRLLDVGAGSAVLSIAAALLGAAHCLAVEADELAIGTARENVERNGVADRVDVVHARFGADALPGPDRFDGVVCNIEAHHLVPLLPGLAASVAPGGWLLLSGILDDQWAGLESTVRELGFGLREMDEDGEWRSGLFRRVSRTPGV